MADKKRGTNNAAKDGTPEKGTSKKGTFYRSATTGRYVTRSADMDPSVRAHRIRERFRAAGRRFSDSSEIVREDRDPGTCEHQRVPDRPAGK